MPATGPDFIALHVRDLDRSAAFYEEAVGLTRAPEGPPHAAVFATEPITFAVREPTPDTDLDATPFPGMGVSVWFHADDAQGLHDSLAERGVRIVQEPIDGPFGRTFAFADPDGHRVTIHDRK